MNKLFQKDIIKKWLPQLLLWGFILVCARILVTLCFDRGIDFDEAYSCRTARDNNLLGICRAVIDAHDTDVPLYYQALRIWTKIFGDSILMYRLFSVAGTVATMALGATVIRKTWGYLTAYLFIVPIGFSHALIHISVNIRMYSWTVFLITACALLVRSLAREPEQKGWVWLFLATAVALFCHYFTAFYFLFLYLYLLAALFRRNRQYIWRVFVCGGVSLIPFGIWLIISDFFQLKKSGEGQLSLEKVDLDEMLRYVFQTKIPYSVFMGVAILFAAVLATVLLRKRLKKDWLFVLFCLLIFPIVYFMAAYMASMANHFFIARHIVHGLGLLWLGIAIVVPRINLPAFCSAFLFMAVMAGAAYKAEYQEAYGNIPYLADTEAFIATYMEPGDIVIYNAEEKFDLLYGFYMPDQVFYHVSEISDVEPLAGKRVWFLQSTQTWFSEEAMGSHDIFIEHRGHYGFQIIENCTDFMLLRLEIS